MGEKEDRRRDLRRKLFYRDGWQNDHGDWFVMCGYGCETVLSWVTAGMRKRDPEDRFILDNTYLTCKTGCSFEKVAKDRRRAKKAAARRAKKLVSA